MALNIPSPGLQSPLRAWRLIYGYVAGQFVRISSLKPEDKPQIARHLFSLSEHDRYLRFGFIASNAHIQSYVDSLNFARDHVYGIYEGRASLVAVAHVAHMSAPNQTPFSFGLGSSHCAEFGVSVLASHRGKGYGGRLFNRAVTHARNQGVSQFHIQALTENAQMLSIAKKRGAILVNYGSETEAHLQLPKADFDSRLSELVAEHYGNVDYEMAHQKSWTHATLAPIT
jgi:GNAT superfamily N-acetyltransferase